MLKKILLSVGSAFLLLQSVNLLNLFASTKIVSFLLALFLGWLINLYVTGVFALAGFAFPTQKLMPSSYYTISNPNRLKSICQLLKVDVFRRLLLATLWKNKKQRKGYFNGRREGIEHFTVQSHKSEFGHLIPLIILFFIGIYVWVVNSAVLGITVLIINFIGNFYPILLQRHHRMRIEKIQSRFKS